MYLALKEDPVKQKIDLHMHTTHSDGESDPEALLRICATNGLRTVSVTDHDTLSHVRPCLDIGKTLGLNVIPGIEITCEYQDLAMVHLLGYGLNWQDEKLLKRLLQLKSARENRVMKVVEALRLVVGLNISYQAVARRAGGTVTKRHLEGAIFSDQANVDLLAGLGIDEKNFSEKLLAEGCSAYVPILDRLKMEEAIELVHQAGGICSLAHPIYSFKKKSDKLESFLKELKGMGLDGLEAFYSMHSKEDTEFLLKQAWNLGIFVTAGSDYHCLFDSHCRGVGTWPDYGFSVEGFLKGFSICLQETYWVRL